MGRICANFSRFVTAGQVPGGKREGERKAETEWIFSGLTGRWKVRITKAFKKICLGFMFTERFNKTGWPWNAEVVA